MARQRMVTRTVTVNNCVVLCMDTNEEKAVKVTVKVSGKFPNDDTMFKFITKNYTFANGVIPTRIISNIVEEKLYGMTEMDFMSMAHEITKEETDD